MEPNDPQSLEGDGCYSPRGGAGSMTPWAQQDLQAKFNATGATCDLFAVSSAPASLADPNLRQKIDDFTARGTKRLNVPALDDS